MFNVNLGTIGGARPLPAPLSPLLLVMLCAFPRYEVDSGPCCAPGRVGVLAMVNQRYPTHSPCICGCVCRTGMVRIIDEMPSFVGSWPLEDY